MNQDSFYSIDRLVEFGMGMAMAQQMVKMMNDTMQNMYVPGSAQTIPQVQPTTIYVAIEGKPVGPLSEKDFSTLVTEKRINTQTLVWTPGMMGWEPIERVPSVLKIIALTPPPLNM
jgi:hypothetical protein